MPEHSTSNKNWSRNKEKIENCEKAKHDDDIEY